MVRSFGTVADGGAARLYTIKNGNGMEASVSDYGATLVTLLVPDKFGRLTDVVLGYDDASAYEAGDVFFGATVGRVANRLKDAAFELNGHRYQLDKNAHGNNLHSGFAYYNKRIWEVKDADEHRVSLKLCSHDGDQGYPGEADITVTYTLSQENALQICYEAKVKEDTLINLTNHSYFNLLGEASGEVLDQIVWIDADAYTRTDAESIPTGELVSVTDTPMDFRVPKKIGREIAADYEALILGQGYDHNYVLNGSGKKLAAHMYAETTGIRMEVYTDLPGMQFYTGNFLNCETGKNQLTYKTRQGVCFETQYFPDAIHHLEFESTVVKAGECFCSETTYKFTQEKTK